MQNLNEQSARYSKLSGDFYYPEKWRKQDTKNKQSSMVDESWTPTFSRTVGGVTEVLTPTEALKAHCEASYELYEAMLSQGIAREMARMVLPVNIYTEFHCCWDMKNLLHFISLRDDSHAQAEIQEYGKAIKTICQKLFPWTMEAYEKYKWKLVEE